MLLSAKICGITPLMMNKFTDAAAIQATEGTRGAMAGERLSAHDDAESRLYQHDGAIIVPSENLLMCITAAGTYHKLGKSKVTTLKSSLVPACLCFSDMWFPLDRPARWQVDTRPVRIPATGGRILRHRPCFEKWSCSVCFSIDPTVLSESLVRKLFDDAGSKIGLGDFRPATRGPFGRFRIDKWTVGKSVKVGKKLPVKRKSKKKSTKKK